MQRIIPIVRDVKFVNLSAKAKAPAKVIVNLWNDPDHPSIITQSSGRYNKLIGFFNNEKHIYVTNNRMGHSIGVENKLRSYVLKYARKAINDKLQELSRLYKEKKSAYQATYKDLDILGQELYDFLDDGYALFKQLNQQISLISPSTVPEANEKLLYMDDDEDTASDLIATCKIPFKNPKNRDLSVRKRRLVDKFLNVFFNSENKKIFAWYMGAVVLNLPISDRHITKYLVISSRNGGVGKSTLMTVLTKGLLGDEYTTVTSDFDQYFANSNRFGSNSIPHTRLVVYSESAFQGPLAKNQNHDFEGLNDSQIKALATEGVINVEAKFQDSHIAQFNNLHVILTNFPPNIPNDRTDLSRRFLPCLMRPTSMAIDKSAKLDHLSTSELIKYVHDNGQAFFDYFANTYKEDPNAFINFDYSKYDVDEESALELETEIQNVDKSKAKRKKLDGLVLIGVLCNENNIPYASFIRECLNQRNRKTTGSNDFIRWRKTEDNEIIMYLDASKKQFMKHPGLLNIRKSLIELHKPIKKFGQNVIPLPITNTYK